MGLMIVGLISTRSADELHLIPHFLRRFRGDQFQKAPRLLPDGIALLPREDDSCVGFPLRQKGGMQTIEVTHIASIQHATLGRSIFQVLLVRTSNHACIQSGGHVYAGSAQCPDKGMPH